MLRSQPFYVPFSVALININTKKLGCHEFPINDQIRKCDGLVNLYNYRQHKLQHKRTEEKKIL